LACCGGVFGCRRQQQALLRDSSAC
jgi:hypothetical protein